MRRLSGEGVGWGLEVEPYSLSRSVSKLIPRGEFKKGKGKKTYSCIHPICKLYLKPDKGRMDLSALPPLIGL